METSSGRAWWRRPSHDAAPKDSPDLAFLMALVTSVGGLTAWTMRRSMPGVLSGLGVGALFAYGGLQITGHGGHESLPHGSHESAHQVCLIGSLMFTGAMSYRAGSNPYTGPGGAMLATLGAVSALYHLDKMVEWRRYEEARVAEAERLLRQHYGSGGSGAAPGSPQV